MCDPVSAGMMIAGTALQYKAQKDAADRSDAKIGQAEDSNDRYNTKILDTVRRNMSQYDPTTRRENMQQRQQKAEQSLTQALTTARDEGRGQINDSTQGKVSDSYLVEKAKRSSDQLDLASNLARMMSKVRAPDDLKTMESLTDAEYASQVGTLANNRGNMARAYQPDIKRAGRPNAGMMLAGGVMQGAGYGNAMGSIYGGTAAGAASAGARTGGTAGRI